MLYSTPVYCFPMGHTTKDKRKLLNRVRRIRGQIEAVERLLEAEKECGEVLQQIAACRGSINGLMAEVIEGHIRCHIAVVGEDRKSPKSKAIEDLIAITDSYLK
jgi:FrmR/RcnR family transcriptional regulator, repressor of frmRAB operon